MNVTIYPDYAFATAQDPANPLHVDEYPYRDGFVGASSPVTLVGDGDLEAHQIGIPVSSMMALVPKMYAVKITDSQYA